MGTFLAAEVRVRGGGREGSREERDESNGCGEGRGSKVRGVVRGRGMRVRGVVREER